MIDDLKWGETPWDRLGREDLLREVQRMFSALQSAQAVILMARGNSPTEGFWGDGGTGGCAVAMVQHALRPHEETDEKREQLYRMFFRYADDLLFPDVPGAGFGWMICDKCRTMTGAQPDGTKATRCIGCEMRDGVVSPVRPIEWRDLAADATPTR